MNVAAMTQMHDIRRVAAPRSTVVALQRCVDENCIAAVAVVQLRCQLLRKAKYDGACQQDSQKAAAHTMVRCAHGTSIVQRNHEVKSVEPPRGLRSLVWLSPTGIR